MIYYQSDKQLDFETLLDCEMKQMIFCLGKTVDLFEVRLTCIINLNVFVVRFRKLGKESFLPSWLIICVGLQGRVLFVFLLVLQCAKYDEIQNYNLFLQHLIWPD